MRTAEHIKQRLSYFVAKGDLETIPSRWQVRAATVAMLPVALSESDRERERSRQTWFGQIPIRVPLQILFNPRQLMADTGLSQRADQIVRHLLSVYHEDAFLGYDLQLLESHIGGLERLAREAQRVVDGDTRWTPFLTRLVSWPGYHQRLVELAEDAKSGKYPDPVDVDPRAATLVGFANFCNSMPDWPAREFYGFDLKRLKGRGERP